MTDSIGHIEYDPVERPGVSNLLMIWSALDERGRRPEELGKMCREEGWGMGRLKKQVEEVVVDRIEPVRKEFERIQGDLGYLRDVAQKGRERARGVASKTMEEVRSVVGLSQI